MERADLSTRVPAVDELLDGVRVGDNLVLLGQGRAGTDALVARFVADPGDRQLVICSTTERWEELPESVTRIDWSRLAGPEETKAAVTAADLAVGGDSVFVFDDLTAIQAAWGPTAALDLFLWACPRLFRRRSLALWVLDADQHDATFLRRLTAVTQVVVDVVDGEEAIDLTVRKADGRAATTVGRGVTLDGDSLEVVRRWDERHETLGALIRAERGARGVGQAELARRVGISASALSQLERGVRGVSADTITRIWEALGVPFGPVRDADRGHRIVRRSALPPPQSVAGLTTQQLIADELVGELWHVTIAPGASGRTAPFQVKAAELVTVTAGVVELDLVGQPTTLQEGDTVLLTTDLVSGWANPGESEAQLRWMVLPLGRTR